MQTFREWCRANGRSGFQGRKPWVTRTMKRPGDLVLTLDKVEVVK